MLGLSEFSDFCSNHYCRKLPDRVGFDRRHMCSDCICAQPHSGPTTAFFEPGDWTGLS